MKFKALAVLCAATTMAVTAIPADAQSSGRRDQEERMAEIPYCPEPLGSIAVIEPDDQWWNRYDLQNPESLLNFIIGESNCFTLVSRGRSMRSRAMERALAEQGELQDGSNVGGGQVRTADYFLEPNIVSANRNSGGGGLGGAIGGLAGGLLGGRAGRLVGGIDVRSGEANVTLMIVNARTTEIEAQTEGYAEKSDMSINAGAALWGRGGWGGVNANTYQNTEIGQIIVLAYLDAYRQMVSRLGGLPEDAAADAPEAR